MGLIPGSGGSPGGGHGNPLQYSCLENLGGRSLVGYSPQAHKESDQLKRLSMHAYTLFSWDFISSDLGGFFLFYDSTYEIVQYLFFSA